MWSLERRAVQQLHHDEMLALVLADVVDRADVRVVERRGGARLAPEAFERLAVVRADPRAGTSARRAAEAGIFGAVDDAHAAAADRLEER